VQARADYSVGRVKTAVVRAPVDLVVRVSLPAAAGNRSLRVVAESPDYFRSSEISLDGDRTPPLNVFEFRDVPPGVYEVTGVLTGVEGRRATASTIARVVPPFGR
jgi:hypothetical protein